MTIVAQSRSYVIGVDCHARTHTYAIIDPRTGEQLGCEQFPTTPSGLNRAISWAARRTGGDATTPWAIEGVATYGAQLARAVTDTGFDVGGLGFRTCQDLTTLRRSAEGSGTTCSCSPASRP